MSARRFTLDTNLLIYVNDPRDRLKQALAQQILAAAAKSDCHLGLQSIGEFYSASVRKKILPPAQAAREVMSFLAAFPSFPASLGAHQTAAREAAAGHFSYWDCVLLASAAEAGCTTMLSEDMKDGARLGAITVRNPFGPTGLSAAAAAALVP